MTLMSSLRSDMRPHSRVLVFADQTVELQPSLHRLLRLSKYSTILESFLQRAARCVCEQARSTPEASVLFPTEKSLLDFCRDQTDLALTNVIGRTVLHSLNQLGWLLWEACQDSSLLQPCGKKIIFASCTGSLAAAAATLARSVSSLLSICLDMLKVALNVGVAVQQRSHRVDPSKGSWALAISDPAGFDAQEIVQQFNQSSRLPPHRRAYVSAVSPTSVSISGPPSTISLFRAASPLDPKHRITELPIGAAYHAPHLRTIDVDSVLEHVSFSETLAEQDTDLITASGSLVSHPLTSTNVLPSILRDIFEHPQNLSQMMSQLRDHTLGSEVEVSFIGPNTIRTSIEALLQPSKINALAMLEPSIPRALDHNASDSNDIAIVGMSGRFPGADDLDALWDVLMQGRDMCQKIPKSRFDIDTHYDPTSRMTNTTNCPWGCFLDNADLFDNLLFHMSPRQAAQTDPVQRLLLLTTYEALEQAGYSYEGREANSVGSFFGSTSDDWREVNAGQSIDMFHIPGGNRAFATGKLNYHFGWEGPAYTIDTACSSSAAAIDLACNALLSRKCRSAIAGGGGILTSSDIFAGLSRANVISPTGSCKTWDKTADGYCRAEAVGVVVLKRLSDAIQDRDNVLAVIKSSLTNHSPKASSITHPHAEQQARLAKQVLDTADLRAEQVDYVEMHGTGTQAGDTAEASSVNHIFSGHRTSARPLHIGTIKPNVGHSEAASGVSSVIKAALMFKHSVMPPHVGIKTGMNPNLPDLAASHIHIPFQATPFLPHHQSDGKRRVLVNNFNITSGSTTILMEDGFQPSLSGHDPRSSHVVAVSAHSESALKANLNRLHSRVLLDPEIDLGCLAYTTTARRMHHRFRRSYAVANSKELTQQIEAEFSVGAPITRSPQTPPVVFVFTGQAAPFIGIGQKLFAECRTFRESLLSSESICQDLQLPSFLDVVRDTQCQADQLEPIQLHLALAALQIALAALWRSWGIQPSAVIGHSLGEYAALCTAGVLSVSDMFFLIGERASLLKKHCTTGAYGMLAVQAAENDVQAVLMASGISDCDVACHNGPNAVVISGPVESIGGLETQIKQHGIVCKRLEVPYAFHSRQMDPILEELQAAAVGVVFNEPTIPVASTVEGCVVSSNSFNVKYMTRHVRNPVRFQEALSDLVAQGISTEDTLWVELGPSQTCLNMVRSSLNAAPRQLLPSLSPTADGWTSLGSSLARAYAGGVDVLWQSYHREFESALRVIDLPSYAFDLKSYWIQYEGDWCVRKHRDAVKQPEAPVHKSTSLAEVVAETITADTASVTFHTDLQEPSMRAILAGHQINNNGLCPGSAYADMAMTAASYIWQRMHPSEPEPCFEVESMDITKPLILQRNAASQPLKITAQKSRGSEKISMTMHALSDGEEVQHLSCTIRPGDGQQWMREWSRNAYLRQSRIETLQQQAQSGKAHHLLHGMVYKLFGQLVDYNQSYRGMQEVFMSNTDWEAVARVQLPPMPEGAAFTCSPYWIESIAHIAGFVLNGNDSTPDDTFYFAHGWDSVRIAQKLDQNKTYWSHVRMREVGAAHGHAHEIAGDVYIFDEEERVVAVVDGIRFHPIQRRLMDALLPRPRGGQASLAGHAGIPHIQLDAHIPHSNPLPAPLRAVPSTHSFHSSVPALSSTRSTTPDDSRHASPLKALAPVMDPVAEPVVASSGFDDTVKELLAEELALDPTQLPATAPLADLGIDSLMLLSLQTRLRDVTGKHVPAGVFARPNTLRDLQRCVVG